MKSSRLLTAYFSPTGTTQKIAHTVAEGMAYPNQDIDLSIPQKTEEISEDTVLLAVVPVYGGRVPAVALERMSQMRGNGQNAVAVVVYGNREFEDALLELKNTMEGIGLPLTGVSTIRGSTPAGITLRFPAGGFPCPAEYPRQ